MIKHWRSMLLPLVALLSDCYQTGAQSGNDVTATRQPKTAALTPSPDVVRSQALSSQGWTVGRRAVVGAAPLTEHLPRYLVSRHVPGRPSAVGRRALGDDDDVPLAERLPLKPFPFRIVVMMPTDVGDVKRNPFRLFTNLTMPVVDVAIADVHAKRILGRRPDALHVTFKDTELSDGLGPQIVVDAYCADQVDAVVGFAYVYAMAPIARMAQYWRRSAGIPIITTIGMQHLMDDKQEYKHLTRMVGSYTHLGSMVVDLAATFDWVKVVFLYESYKDHRTECEFQLLGVRAVFMRRYPNEQFSLFVRMLFGGTQFKSFLQEASRKSNVIILCASPDTVRKIMLAASELGMTESGEYVFINIDVSTGSHEKQPWIRRDESEAANNKAKAAYLALKTISLRRSNKKEYKTFEARVKQRAEEKYDYERVTGKPYEMNNFISAFYDAILLYAIALNETMEAGQNPRDGKIITQRMWNRTFEGITGNVSIDSNGDRYSDYSLLDLDLEANMFKEVAYYSGAQNKLNEVGTYHWIKGKPPKDRPVCGWDKSQCPEGLQSWEYSLIGLSLITVLFSIISFFIYRHYRMEAELAAMTWRIRWEELSGEERRKQVKKNRREGGGGWFTFLAGLDRSLKRRPASVKASKSYDTSKGEGTSSTKGSFFQRRSLRQTNSAPAHRKFSEFFERKFSTFNQGLKTSSDSTHGNGGGGGGNRLELTAVNVNVGAPLVEKKSVDTLKSSSGVSPSRSRQNSNFGLATHAIPEETAIDDVSGPGSRVVSSKRGSQAANDSHRIVRQDSWGSLKSACSIETLQPNASQIYTKTAVYKGSIVAIKKLNIVKQKVELTRSLLIELKKMKDLQHDHITRFTGACIDPPHFCIVTEYCPKGSLEDILENDSLELDSMMMHSLLHDLVKGMHFLHTNSDIRTHGKLKSSNCVVDSRFVLKVTDFGLHRLHALEEPSEDEIEETHAFWKKKLWTAPELLRASGQATYREGGTQKGDAYSFAIILHEMLFRKGVFWRTVELAPKEIVARLIKGEEEPFRPEQFQTQETEREETLVKLMVRCWDEQPQLRPDFDQIRKTVRALNKEHETSNIVDNLLKRMEQYANNLETLVDERTSDYMEEKRKVEDLLHQLLPRSVADTLIKGEAVRAEAFDSVTIYFSDIVGFTALSSQSTPMEVVALLNDLYTSFDATIQDFEVYKVETIGDAYMVVSGLPERNGDRHAGEIAKMSLGLLNRVKTFKIRHRPNDQLKLRIGLHSGPVVSGVVGLKMPRYCLFGDTVNTASRMESNGLPLKIHMSSSTKDFLAKDPGFTYVSRGEVEMKGKGVQVTYWLTGYNSVTAPDSVPSAV